MAHRMNWDRERQRKQVAAATQNERQNLDILKRLAVATQPRDDQYDAPIEKAFKRLFAGQTQGWFAEFAKSLHEQWERDRFLTDKQRETLFRCAQKTRLPKHLT